jgi:hypothetical protein
MAHPFKDDENRGRLLAKLVREILLNNHAAEFDTLADVVDALKARCARLRIPWTNDDISAALHLVASNVEMPNPRVLDARRRRMAARERALEQQTLSRAEASAILHRLGIRL